MRLLLVRRARRATRGLNQHGANASRLGILPDLDRGSLLSVQRREAASGDKWPDPTGVKADYTGGVRPFVRVVRLFGAIRPCVVRVVRPLGAIRPFVVRVVEPLVCAIRPWARTVLFMAGGVRLMMRTVQLLAGTDPIMAGTEETFSVSDLAEEQAAFQYRHSGLSG
jgi:hypothetical protein